MLGPVKGGITRPITGLARKSVFGTLAAWVEGGMVADLYCGTGTLGLEALSRGAAKCWFAEQDQRTLERLRQNVADLRVEGRATVWAGDVSRRLEGWLAGVEVPLDLAFVDPPFEQARHWDWRRVEAGVFVPLAGRLGPEGLVVLRTDRQTEVPEEVGPLRTKLVKTFGNMAVRFYARAEAI